MDTANIQTIIWDLDNTLYKFSDDQVEKWCEAVVTAMLARDNIDLPFDEAMALSMDGWKSHRNSNHHFIRQYGICPREAHLGMFAHIRHDLIAPCIDTPRLMESMRGKRHAIVTYATKDWAHRVLDHTGLADFFQTDLIIGAEDYNFESKEESPKGIQTMLDKIGGNPLETLFVEDTLQNLEPAKRHTGVLTAYLHHDRPVNDGDMTHVDIVAKDTPELIQKWFKVKPEA